MDKTNDILTRGVEQVLPNKKDLLKLMVSRKIRLYLGIDPTGTRLHLGHTIPLRKLQEFAELDHEAILLFGTGTVLAGDPSQRSAARPKITQKEINNNIKTWKEQASKIIDFNKVQIKQNGDWLLKLSYADIINIASHISSVQLFKREMFQERLKRGDTVWTHETLYPLFQGYDSVVMDVDLEIGGTDQTFNMLIGRELQKKMKNREKYVLTTPLISGTDGQPMSKSSGNCIWLDDSPQDMYGKIMSRADARLGEYWKMLTNFPEQELKNLKPMDAKKKLAFQIVKIYCGEEKARAAQENFENVIQNKRIPISLPTIPLVSGVTIAQTMLDNNLVGSISDAKNLANQGGVSISHDRQNFIPVSNPKVVEENDYILKIGTTSYYEVTKKKK